MKNKKYRKERVQDMENRTEFDDAQVHGTKENAKKKYLWLIIIVLLVLLVVLPVLLGAVGIFLIVVVRNINAAPPSYIEEGAKKPVIYLYPEETMDVCVLLEYDGELTCTYPEYNDGWYVTAQPDGTLTDVETGKEYSYLFWEGVSDTEYDMSKGYVVAGEDTAAFLQDVLARMGMTPREYNEFIVYWLPLMQDNPYNLITFQQEVYTDAAELYINPQPDSILRVFMAYQALEEPIEVEESEIVPFEREGFCVVEWGGTEVK